MRTARSILALLLALAGAARADVTPPEPNDRPEVDTPQPEPQREPPPVSHVDASCFVGDSTAGGITVLAAIALAAGFGVRRKRGVHDRAAPAAA